MKWPLGRVIKTYKGPDDVVRVADVQTSSGILKRAIQYLAPLPKLSDEPEEDGQQPDPKFQESKANHEGLAEKQSPQSTSNSMPLAKKQRTLPGSIMTTLITILLLIPLVATNKIEITQFEPNIGLYFEGIGNTRISRSEWNIISYYNLNPFWQEMATFINETTALTRLCNLLTQKTTCSNVLQAISFSITDLKDKNLLLKRRVKRGAINVVGNVANSLFGILDSDYAEQMTNTINTVNENENHLKQLLMNQTSIVDATLNVLKQNEENVKQKFRSVDDQLTEITSRLHETEKEQYQAKLFRMFMLRSVQLSVTSSRLHRIQSEIIAALTDSHHGKISPMLLSPSQLQSEIVQIINHLPTSLELPVSNDNMLQLYKLMNVKGGVTKDHVIFHISIPLCDPETFELLKPHQIPVLTNGTMLAIRPCGDLLAVNAHRDQYFILTERQWASCATIKEDEFLCQHMQSKYKANANKCLCELSLLNHNIQKGCDIGPIAGSTLLTQLEYSNQWLYTMQQPSRISSVCGQEKSQLTLKGSGLLKLASDCTLKFNSIIIKGHQIVSTSLQASYIRMSNFSDIIYPVEVQFEKVQNKVYADQIKNISEIQITLHQKVSDELPSQIKHIQYHHGTVAYVALTLAIIIIMAVAWKKARCKSFNPNQQTPQPAARQHIPAQEFAVTVT